MLLLCTCVFLTGMLGAFSVGRAQDMSNLSQYLGPGCHLASDAEKKEMADRGIPPSFQVCPKDSQILGVGKNFEQWYAQLKSQSPCTSNACTLSCRTRNTGAQVCGPTASRWNAIGCHPNNNTAIFPSVPYGFAAHIELLRRYCGERGRCTIGSVIAQWTGVPGDRPAYASFVSRNAGIPVNQVFDPNDIDLMGRLALAMSCYEAGALPYSVSDLKQGLIMAAGGQRVAVPSNVGQLLNESLTGSYAVNPSYSPSSHPGSWSYVPSTLNGNNYIGPTPPSSPLPLLSQTSAAQGTQQSAQVATQQSSTQASSPASLPVTPSALLIAQPQRVKGGFPVVVAWTSVGTDPNIPCQLSSNAQVIAQGNEGYVSVQTPPVAASTTADFLLQCRALRDGSLVQQTSSIAVY